MIRVLFDNQEIDSLYITRLHQTVQPFNNEFKIGNTIVRQFSLDVRNEGFSDAPDQVILYEDNGSDDTNEWTVYATLFVDDIDYSNEVYATLSLVDGMILFNQALSYEVGETIQTILNRICSDKNISLNASNLYMSDFEISWEDNLSERDLISYVAEVNGGYAYMDSEGDLCIIQYTNVSSNTIDINECSDFKIGAKHLIDRVYVELAEATQFYPSSSTNDTLYLNPDNILLTGNDSYSTSNILRHICSVVSGFTFYNVTIEKSLISASAEAGQLIYITGLGSSNIPFICTIDYEYNLGWSGGYTLQLECKNQQETQVPTSKEMVRRMKITVDRELGVIRRSVANIESGVAAQISIVEQRADELSVRVAANESSISENGDRLTTFETAVSIRADGVKISRGTEGAYVKVTDAGLEIYVQGIKTAWAEADGYSATELMIGDSNSTEKWHLHEANNGNTLMFLRR